MLACSQEVRNNSYKVSLGVCDTASGFGDKDFNKSDSQIYESKDGRDANEAYFVLGKRTSQSVQHCASEKLSSVLKTVAILSKLQPPKLFRKLRSQMMV